MNVPGGQYKVVPMQVAIVAIGNGTAIATVDTGGALTAVGIQITGITTATVTFEATIDGTNWVSILAENVTTGVESATTTANGIFRITCIGMVQIRARISAWTTGAITITGVAVA
jgi:hypothetical protein